MPEPARAYRYFDLIVGGFVAVLLSGGCGQADLRAVMYPESTPYADTDSMGVVPGAVVVLPVQARQDLVENSAAVISRSQPDVVFTINDSGNEPVLFAVDTTGSDRGAWRVNGATNVDWEAASSGPCATLSAGAPSVAGDCLYIGDTGDNEARRPSRAIYRVAEPRAESPGYVGSLPAERLSYRYPDGPHDVEAMYVAPDGVVYLITKRPERDRLGRLRPALIFSLPRAAWDHVGDTEATLVDSLPIVPGSAPGRVITDASLSPDGRRLAVRTYAQIYVFAIDSATSRPHPGLTPAVCNIAFVEDVWGEGLTWYADAQRLLLTAEGLNAPMHVLACPPLPVAASPVR